MTLPTEFPSRFLASAAGTREGVADQTGNTMEGGDIYFAYRPRVQQEEVHRFEHGDHSHLVYALGLPRHPGPVQKGLDIQPEASYLIAVKNPHLPSPPGVGLSAERRADLPSPLQQRFGSRRFIPADPELLNHEGVEVVLIGASLDVEQELGVHLVTEDEDAASAEIFHRLRMPPERHPTEPLIEGEWR